MFFSSCGLILIINYHCKEIAIPDDYFVPLLLGDKDVNTRKKIVYIYFFWISETQFLYFPLHFNTNPQYHKGKKGGGKERDNYESCLKISETACPRNFEVTLDSQEHRSRLGKKNISFVLFLFSLLFWFNENLIFKYIAWRPQKTKICST